jgi:hypothetical protein
MVKWLCLRGMVELTSYKKLFSRKKPARAMKPAKNFSHSLFSELFTMIVNEINIQGDNSVEHCI